MGTGRGAVSHKRVPCLRGIDPDLRRARLIAARTYPVGAVPRYAIMMGHWDLGRVVSQGGRKEGESGR